MELLKWELRKIWRPGILAAILLLGAVYYWMFPQFYIEHFCNGPQSEAQFDLASDWVERYGPTLEPEERAELDEQMAGEITAFDTQITAIPEAAAAGLTDYKSFLSFRGDYLNGIRNTDGQADMDVEALLYRVYGGTNWYRIEALADTLETYDTQEDHRALIVSNRQQLAQPEAMVRREAELASSDMTHSLLPSSVKYSTQEYGKDLAVWCVLSIVLLLSPTLVDINRIKGLPKNKQVIVTTGSQGEEMSALYRMAFSQHKQVEIGAGDKVIISASAIPGNEVTVSRVINELFRKGVKVVYDRADMLHVSGHACQEELKIIHALTKPRFFIPLHGEQRMLQIHSQLAQDMGMDRNHIAIADNGSVIEITAKTIKLGGTVPSGEVYVDGSGVGDVGAVVMRDRKRLAEDGMVVVVLPISAHDGNLLSEPEIITRGFIYVKESGDLMKELQSVARDAAENVSRKRGRDDGELKGSVKSAVSSYLFKTTKRNPMVIPVVTRL